MKRVAESEAAALRRLAEQKRQEQAEDLKQKQLDALWLQKRDEHGLNVVMPTKGDLVRRAQAAAQRGELSLRVELGVDEKRLRAYSGEAALTTAEAVLHPNAIASKSWNHTERVGWILQSPDGQRLSKYGEELLKALREMGFQASFTPFEVKDNAANPFVNMAVQIQW